MAPGTDRFARSPEQIRPLVPGMGACIASDRITHDGVPVGSMVRQPPLRAGDSGWVFVAGDETEVYFDDTNNLKIFEVNTIANYDPAIIPYLYALPGQRFDRVPGTDTFVEAADSKGDDSEAGLPAGVRVVQGRVRISDSWSIELPWPVQRRLERLNLVLSRPCLSFWIADLRGGADLVTTPPGAFDVQDTDALGVRTFSYRLRGDAAKVPSLYAVVAGSRDRLQVAAHVDREDDVIAARAVLASLRER